MEDLFMWYLQHTYFWATAHGAAIDVPWVLDYMRLTLVVGGVIFYIVHKVHPYSQVSKMVNPTLVSRPPENVFFSFSAGQLVAYLMNTLGLPFVLFQLWPYPQDWPTSDLITKAFVFLGILVFFIGSAFVEHRIDQRR